MSEENKKQFERDDCCPSSIAPSDEVIKDKDCEKCYLRSNCYYLNSDEPKSEKSYWCNRVKDSYLKTLKTEVELERRKSKQKASSNHGKECDTMDLLDDLLDNPRKTREEKEAYLKRVEKRREVLENLEKENYEWQMFRRPYLLEAEERAKRDWEARKRSVSESVDEKLHDLMHEESSLEVDRQRVRKNTNTNTNNK